VTRKGVKLPCQTLSAEARAEIETQLRAQGRLFPVGREALEKLRRHRLIKAGGMRNDVDNGIARAKPARTTPAA
jgi:hypothetical protein